MSSNDKKNVHDFEAKKKPAKKINWIMIGSVVILVLSAIIFVLVPALTGFESIDTEVPVLGSYKGNEIKYEQGSDFLNYMSEYYQQTKDNGYDPEEYLYSILNTSFNATVLNMAITDAVESSKYVVPDAAVNRVMRSHFTDENGKYSTKIYNEADKSKVQELFTTTEKQLVTERYLKDFIGMGAASYYGEAEYLYGGKVSSNETPFVSSLNAEKRQFQVIAVNTSDAPDEVYTKFAEENASLFDQLNYSIVSSNYDEDLTEIIDLVKSQQITFDDAATQLSMNAFNPVDGKLDLYDYQIKESILADPDDYEGFISLGVGDISTIVHTQNGYALFRRNTETKPADFTDPAVMEVVKDYVQYYKADVIEDYFMDQGKDLAALASRIGFEEAAAEYGFEVIEPTAFPCNYGNNALFTTIPTSQYTQLSGVETDKNFLKTAFSLNIGEVSEPFLIGDYVIILKYKEAVPQDEAVASSMAYLYPYYTSTFAQEAIETALVNSDDVKNDVLTFYFKYYMGY